MAGSKGLILLDIRYKSNFYTEKYTESNTYMITYNSYNNNTFIIIY